VNWVPTPLSVPKVEGETEAEICVPAAIGLPFASVTVKENWPEPDSELTLGVILA
jgi:hypothetical protein